MSHFSFSLKCLGVMMLLQIVLSVPPPKEKAEKVITKKLKSATPAQIEKYKMDAAKRMQNDIAKCIGPLSNDAEMPATFQQDLKQVQQALKAGKLQEALAKSMHTILQKASSLPGKPADQLAYVLGGAMAYSPPDLKNPLQGALNFLQSNMNGVNTALVRVSGGAPDLLQGTVKSLSSTLGVVQDSVNGSVGSVGQLLGGLLTTVN